MKQLKSNLENSEELVKLINKETKYKSKVAYFNTLLFAKGNTLTIKKDFFNSIQLVYDNGELIFYTRTKLSEFSSFIKKVIKDMEKLTKKEVIIRDGRLITFGGR